MTCSELRTDDLEAYLAGTLGDADMTRVELHMFDCNRCFDTLETLRAARAVLAEPASRATAWWRRPSWAVAASLAAVLATAAMVRWAVGTESGQVTQVATQTVVPPATPVEPPAGVSATPPVASVPATPAPAPAPAPSRPAAAPRTSAADALRALVKFDAPPVLALTVRSANQPGAGLSPALTAALRSYVGGDFRQAFAQFNALDRADRDLSAVQYFGGISALKLGRLADARRWLARATEGDQATSAVEAWLYLGYAHLAGGDARAAITAIDRYIELDGDRGAAARQLKDDILAIAPAR